MANNIKGITVEIGGDTGPLNKALKDSNKVISDTQGELKEINRQLKFDPSNTTLLTQKQKLLGQEIATTKDKVAILKEAARQAQEQFNNGELGESKLRAVQREAEKAESQLKGLEDQLKKMGAAGLTQISETSKKISDATGKAGKALLPVTLAIGGVSAAAVNAGNNFEAQMSRVSGISGATGDDLESLKNQALQLGQDTAFSASETAQGMENLASAGFTTQEIMEAMPGMLDLAASSGEDLAGSADIAASTLRGFGLAASDAGHVADVLAKNAADTNAAVADTGAAMKYIAPVAQNAGWSLESVTAAIGEMADAGIKGEQAGTTLRGALTNLMNPSKEQAAAMKEIGFQAYDANGKMKPLSQIIGELSTKTKGMSDEQRDNVVATIMGTSALSGMQVLLKDGSTNLDTLTASLKDSDGASKQMAETMQGNTKGAIEQMGGALETAAIKIQEILAPIITYIANSIGDLVSKFSGLDEGTQKVILTILGIVAAVAPVLLIASKVAAGISAVTGAMAMMKTATMAQTIAQYGLNAALLANPVTWIVVAIVAAVALLVVGIKHLWDTNEGFRTAVINIWNGIQSTVGGVVNALVTFFTVTIPQAWNGIIAFFTETIPAWIQSVIDWFNQLPYMIGYAIGAILAGIVNFGVAAWNWVTVELPKIIQGIIDWFAQLPGRIWTFLVYVVTGIGQWGANMIASAAVLIPQLINSIVTFFSELPGKIWTWLTNVVTNVVSWAGNLVTTAQTEIPKFVSSVVNFIGELPGKMLDIGKNIVTGIWDGINGAIDWLHDKISSFCKGIVDGFKEKLKIHSPSQLFADIVGKNLALGIGQGFTENMKAVVASMTAAIPTTWDTGIEVRTAMAAAYGGYSVPISTSQTKGSEKQTLSSSGVGDITVQQYFQGKVPTPAENARLTRNGLQQVVQKIRKG